MLKGFGNEKWIVGYDLGWEYAQISYCNVARAQVETLSSTAGSENYSIPVALCKRPGINQWFYGTEALRYARESGGILAQDLLHLALEGEPVYIEETEYDPTALLTLFLQRSLGMLSGIAAADKIEALMITCDRLDEKMVEMLERIAANLRLKTAKICFQSHQESYYHYMLRQDPDLWRDTSVLFDYHGNRMGFLRLECNRKTQPITVFIHQSEEEFPARTEMPADEQGNLLLDREFLRTVREKLDGFKVSSVYLIGEDFSEEWLKESLKFLCEGRRIFLGNNLFSKGACYGLLERFSPGENTGKYVFLGNDKLKSNIGMKVMQRGQETYLALLDAGNDWKKAETSWEFYLREEKKVEITVTSLSSGRKWKVPIMLEQLPGDIARIRMSLYMKEENLLEAEFEDLGFGEFRPAENRRWTQEIIIS